MGDAVGQLWFARTTSYLLETLLGNKGVSEEELHWITITPVMRQVLLTFSTTAIGEHFYLAGGTALALQLGHRQSIDLDFFSFDQDIPAIVSPLKDALGKFSPILADLSWGNLVFVAEGSGWDFMGMVFRW